MLYFWGGKGGNYYYYDQTNLGNFSPKLYYAWPDSSIKKTEPALLFNFGDCQCSPILNHAITDQFSHKSLNTPNDC